MKKKLLIFITILLLINKQHVIAQSSVTGSNVIATAVPFLIIAPDSRGSALGETGVATSPDANSQFWNPAKYAFTENKMGLSLSYSPWMRSAVSDMNLSYLTYFAHIDDYESLSASMRYFSYGSMPYYDANSILQSYQNPNEFAFDFAYTSRMSRKWSSAIALRYIRSDMARGMVDEINISPTNAFSADFAVYYRNIIHNGNRRNAWNFGMVLSNIGTPVSYDEGVTKNFLPANMRIGVGNELALDRYNKICFSLDICKLLVPTPNYTLITNEDGLTVFSAENNDYGIMGAIIHSFYDAPGGLREELQEYIGSVGVEYLYNNQFALRTGLFNEHMNKGGRKYITLGTGITLSSFTFDLSYLYTLSTISPLENTLRFSVTFNFDEWR